MQERDIQRGWAPTAQRPAQSLAESRQSPQSGRSRKAAIAVGKSGDILTNFGYVSGFGGITVGANDTVVNALEIRGKFLPTGHLNSGILLGTNSAVTNLAKGVIMGNQAIVTSGAEVVTN
jgi:hypothetical protein